jgi:superoxide dismutase, Cu-Zn family
VWKGVAGLDHTVEVDKPPGMTKRPNWLSAIGLLVAVAAAPACKQEKKAADTPPPADPAAQTPPAETPPPTPAETPPPADPAAQTPPPADPAAGGGGGSATADMKAASASQVSGTVTFSEKDGKVEVAVDLKGLKPGEHGFHIHEKGDCSSPDAKSAGDHFNPDKKDHGAPDAPVHHAGDLGNLTAGEDGTVKTTTTVDFLTLADGPNSAVGKAVIVHEKADDMKSQPAGNAGARIACGIVEKK